ncbi:MAG: TetR/AcrR family transcriptional regulator [Acidobacteriota bacterium]|nr:TetR/AcrR family transcriptional regulator [Acidobacteriota bacterium]MDE3190080.1 TetR/AcrR family transcriptional regulator [Acidobacteriota bacterium]
MRADAQRNLDRVLGAALACFAEGGIDVSVDEVARRAGVGHGTVFRRFPTKEALIDAVLGKELDRMVLLAQAALADEDVWDGFAAFFGAVAEGYARNRALVESKERCKELPQMRVIQDAAHELVRRAQEAGALRPDLSADEIFELVPAASRFPGVILDGLRGKAGVDRLRPEAGAGVGR